jgi:hypothetical protein
MVAIRLLEVGQHSAAYLADLTNPKEELKGLTVATIRSS